MSHIWTFSSSSQTHVQRCINAAVSPDASNKWFKEFGYLNKKPEENIVSTESDSENSCFMEEDVNTVVMEVVPNHKVFLETIEAEPILRFDFLVEECMKYKSLIVTLAKELSGPAIEKIFNIIHSKTDLNTAFIQYFYQYFFPVYLKREYTWFTLDLLIKSYRTHPAHFKTLINMLLKDLDIPNKVLQDFVLNLDENGKSEFMSRVMDNDFTDEEFVHHLFSIYSAYKDCEKTELLQNHIITLLSHHSQVCSSDRHYGRLLLAYLQAQLQNSYPVNFGNVERIIEMHRSPFKRPCLTVLSELIEQHNAEVMEPRALIILRPDM